MNWFFGVICCISVWLACHIVPPSVIAVFVFWWCTYLNGITGLPPVAFHSSHLSQIAVIFQIWLYVIFVCAVYCLTRMRLIQKRRGNGEWKKKKYMARAGSSVQTAQHVSKSFLWIYTLFFFFFLLHTLAWHIWYLWNIWDLSSRFK